MIRAKLPGKALLKLEILHETETEWTVNALRERLHEYITAREHAEKKDTQVESTVQQHNNSRLADVRPKRFSNIYRVNRNYQRKKDGNLTSGNKVSGIQSPSSATTAATLVANTKQTSENRFYDQCRYCNKMHWIDECTKYSIIEKRKKQLRYSCYKCLKVGHMSKDCKRNQTCVYCG